ncbi:MAG: FAD-dependent oxidoreductase, partial [Candidatus Kapaibacterium sp.]
MKKKVLIIGAGFAGIGATIQAIEQGCDVLVIEGRPYIGGRASSFIDKDTGEIIDNGQHVMMGCYGAVLHILRRLGTEQLLYRQKALSVTFFDQNGEADILD